MASPPAENDDEDLSDVEVVEIANPKIQRRSVGKAKRKGKCYPGEIH